VTALAALAAVATTAITTASTASSTVSVALAAITVTAVATVATVATVAVSGSPTTIAISVAVTIRGWTLLVRVVIRFYLLEELFAKLLGLGYTFRPGSTKIHQ
jgi:predicted signal transduction protein with EAL and GGDEF domain